jgi:hypothetical protein
MVQRKHACGVLLISGYGGASKIKVGRGTWSRVVDDRYSLEQCRRKCPKIVETMNAKGRMEVVVGERQNGWWWGGDSVLI